MPTQAVCNAFGVMNAARHRKYDESFFGRASIDWVLRTLLEDRAVLADIRYYFDCGRIFSGRGGNVGLVTPETFKKNTLDLKRKWGKHISFNAPGYVKNRQVDAMHFSVSRTNSTAQR